MDGERKTCCRGLALGLMGHTRIMPRIIRSPQKKKEHKKKRRILSTVIFLFTVALLGFLVWFPSIPSLQIKNIVIEGNKVLTKEEVKKKVEEELAGKYFHLFPKTNIFFYPKEAIVTFLRQDFPRIANVSDDLDTERILFVSLTEREPFSLWCGKEIPETPTNETCYYLDDQGYVFGKAPSFSGNAYFEFYGKGTLPLNDPIGHNFMPLVSYQQILKIKERLENFQVQPIGIFVADDGSAEFMEKNGYKIRFNTDQDVSSLLSNMQTVFQSSSWKGTIQSGTLEYLDFRFGNKVYYKYKNQVRQPMERTNNQE